MVRSLLEPKSRVRNWPTLSETALSPSPSRSSTPVTSIEVSVVIVATPPSAACGVFAGRKENNDPVCQSKGGKQGGQYRPKHRRTKLMRTNSRQGRSLLPFRDGRQGKGFSLSDALRGCHRTRGYGFRQDAIITRLRGQANADDRPSTG